MVAVGPVGTPQEPSILADLGLKPTIAVGAGFYDPSAVSTPKPFLLRREESSTANAACLLGVSAIRVVGATVECVSVPRIFAPLKASLDAPWTVDVLFRRLSKNGDVVPVLDEFLYERRLRTSLRKEIDLALGPSDRDVEQPPFFGVRVPLGRRDSSGRMRRGKPGRETESPVLAGRVNRQVDAVDATVGRQQPFEFVGGGVVLGVADEDASYLAFDANLLD